MCGDAEGVRAQLGYKEFFSSIRVCKHLILNGEMSEWLREHAWKTKRTSATEPLQSVSTHTRSATSPSRTITPCASVNLDVLRGSEGHVSQSCHNGRAHLAAPFSREATTIGSTL